MTSPPLPRRVRYFATAPSFALPTPDLAGAIPFHSATPKAALLGPLSLPPLHDPNQVFSVSGEGSDGDEKRRAQRAMPASQADRSKRKTGSRGSAAPALKKQSR